MEPCLETKAKADSTFPAWGKRRGTELETDKIKVPVEEGDLKMTEGRNCPDLFWREKEWSGT